jgi:hypothetical protein
MTLKHLNFEELSDLIDDELSEEQKKYCLAHITVCEICGKEYESLLKCMTLLSSLKNECVIVPDFSERTIIICRSREKKKLFLKAIPAIAASVIIIAGAGFIRTGIFSESGSYVATSLTGQNDTQRIIETVSRSKGKILKISHSYIDCEFDKTSHAAIKKILCQNKIKHALIVNTGMLVNPTTGGMEDASYTYSNSTVSDTSASRNQNYAVIDNNKVRMRIFK